RDVGPGDDLRVELLARDNVSIVGLELEEEAVIGGRRGEELLVLGQVELSIGLEELAREELRRWHEARRTTDLGLGGLEPATPDLLADQPIQDELVPGRLLDLAVHRGGDRL